MSKVKGPDPRLNPYRPDLAAEHLRGEVEATRFVEGTDMQVVTPVAPILRRPQTSAPMETQALFGETFRVYEEKDGWAWGQAALDDYVGYVEASALSKRSYKPTHSIAALRTFIFPKPDLKSRPVTPLSINAKVRVVGARGDYSEIERGGYVFTAHLAPVGAYVRDFVTVAEQFVGVPYLWGGRDSFGVDCSGLVQAALERAGISALRDTDLLEAALGEPLKEPVDLTRLRRGDLVFWKGHMGVMVDGLRLIHSNATHMRTVIEPLEIAAARIAKTEGDITSVKRLPAR